MGKNDRFSRNNDRELLANHSPGSANSFNLKRVLENSYLLMHKTTICDKSVGFPFLIKKNLRLSSFPQAKWTVGVNKTNSDCFI